MRISVSINFMVILLFWGCATAKSGAQIEQERVETLKNSISGETNLVQHQLIKFRILLEIGVVREKFQTQLDSPDIVSSLFIWNIKNLEKVLELGNLPENLDEILKQDNDKNMGFKLLDDNIDLIIELTSQKGVNIFKLQKTDGQWLLLK